MDRSRTYNILKRQVYVSDEFKIVPIREEDRYAIMEWRNEQMYHLRQKSLITKEFQDCYFYEVVSSLFTSEKPEQILFSYLKNEKCLGYGGLVHINWTDLNCEVSFIMKTSEEESKFEYHWSNFLSMIKEVAFEELRMMKVFTYAFDIRPHLYPVLESNDFVREAELRDHCIVNGQTKDVIIHSCFAPEKRLVRATEQDLNKTFEWLNNDSVRQFSHNRGKVSFEDHSKWFNSAISDHQKVYYMLLIRNQKAGSLRFDFVDENELKINYLVDPEFQRRGLGQFILNEGVKKVFEERKEVKSVFGLVHRRNDPSIKIFERAGFTGVEYDSDNLIFRKRK